MSKKIERVKDGNDVNRALDRKGLEHRHCDGSHCVGTLPDGSKFTYHDHHEYGPGLSNKLTKILRNAGVILVGLAIVTPLVLQALGYQLEVVW